MLVPAISIAAASRSRYIFAVGGHQHCAPHQMQNDPFVDQRNHVKRALRSAFTHIQARSRLCNIGLGKLQKVTAVTHAP
jgi:hypothetical protein